MAEENQEYVEDDVIDENEEQEVENNEESYVSAEEFERLKEEKEKIAQYLQKANNEAKQYRLKAKEYEEAGMSPDEIKELREKQEKQRQKELEKKGEWEKLKSQLQQDYESKLSEKDQEVQRVYTLMEKNFVGREVEGAISKHDGISTLLRPHVESAVKLIEEDGEFVARVVDKDGSPKFNSQGDYMSVEEFVGSLKEDEDFGLAFRGRGQSGGGTKSSAGAGNAPAPKKSRGNMSMDEKGAYIKQYGIEEYNKLPL